MFAEFAASFARLALTGLCRLWTGARLRWTGCLPETVPRLYFANHSSHLDGLFIWTSLPPELRKRTSLVAAGDYWLRTAPRRWLVEQVFRVIPVERKGMRKDDCGKRRHPLEKLAAALHRGESLIFFPEGTRHVGEEMLPFKSGLYHLAKMCPEAELVPVYLNNFYRVLPKGSRLMVPILCTAVVGVPLRLEQHETRREFLERMRGELERLKAGET